MFDEFQKICRENSSYIKVRQEQAVLYMKTFVHVRCIANFRLKLKNISDKSCSENQNTFLVQ